MPSCGASSVSATMAQAFKGVLGGDLHHPVMSTGKPCNGVGAYSCPCNNVKASNCGSHAVRNQRRRK